MAPATTDKLAKFRALQDKFAHALPERFAEIQEGWRRAQLSPHDPGVLAELYRNAHSLAGSAGTFNFFRLGERARDLELLIKQYLNGDGSLTLSEAIEKILAQLTALAAQGPEAPLLDLQPEQQAPVDPDSQPLIYVLEDDEYMAAESAIQLNHFGYRVEVFTTAPALTTAMSEQIPDALLIDIHLPEGKYAGTEVVAGLRERLSQDIPILFMSRHNTWEYRLNALRAGGQAYLPKPIDFDQLADHLEILTGRHKPARYRVLIVDDTVLLAEHYATVLQEAGMATEIINEPSRLLEVLPSFLPDLILMDLYMPGSTGMEAAQIIRQHGGYSNLPIVYLSTESELDQQLNALRAGGDDFLQKPINDQHLVSAVSTRAKRFRELRELIDHDGLTGSLNHISLKLALERELAKARRNSSCLSFAMLDIDFFKRVNDQYGHPVGDRVIKGLARLLAHRLRKGDIAARYGGEEFAMILPDTSPDNARLLLDELRQAFARIIFVHEQGNFSCTFSAGIATFPPHAHMQPLIKAADQALYQAKHTGRNRVAIEQSR